MAAVPGDKVLETRQRGDRRVDEDHHVVGDVLTIRHGSWLYPATIAVRPTARIELSVQTDNLGQFCRVLEPLHLHSCDPPPAIPLLHMMPPACWTRRHEYE
eukprot:CAMPEP_0182527400 /NCGR_PEP_ID=MMETSP1323-20130603/3818_1 /TAXON_ID=236787 /ORGANISM="Florenciella parvula, Strain RCC1693" /LENGTH=100 /DNA_ID=CAMNT_0024736373 /DNA_START=239 /DNA_END=538 /DNA_ORIENTATION=+